MLGLGSIIFMSFDFQHKGKVAPTGGEPYKKVGFVIVVIFIVFVGNDEAKFVVASIEFDNALLHGFF